jgi:chromosome segregation ATPase
MDPAWKKALDLHLSNPELIWVSGLIAVAGFGAAWLLRTLIGRERVATLKDQNANLERRLSEAKEKTSAAEAEQERIARNLETITGTVDQQAAEIARLKTVVETPLPATARQPPPQQSVQIYVTNLLTNVTSSTATLSDHLRSVTHANTSLGVTLHEISSKLEGAGKLEATANVMPGEKPPITLTAKSS